jgi:hypothetical protein
MPLPQLSYNAGKTCGNWHQPYRTLGETRRSWLQQRQRSFDWLIFFRTFLQLIPDERNFWSQKFISFAAIFLPNLQSFWFSI